MSEMMTYKDSELQLDSRLILCIEEHDSKENENSIDNRMFIGWSFKKNEFFIIGKRQDTGFLEFVPYVFYCKTVDETYEFIRFVIGTRETTSLVLYNYNNTLDKEDNELSYEFFEMYMDKNYEISAYDNVRLNKGKLTSLLRMLKCIY